MSQPDVGWVSDSVTQQIQEQSPKYSGGTKMLGYATLTQPTILPNGWARAKLEDLIRILDSMRKPVNNTERQDRIEGKLDSELFPYYGATGEVGKIDNYLFDEELVALGEDGVPFLDAKKSKAYMLHGKTWVNNHAHVLKAIDGITTNSFILNFLNQFDYQGYVNGGTRLKLTQANMRKIPVPLPPLTEQQQISAKLDELLTQVDTLKPRLDTIPKILKRFRQSVLAAAVSGMLSEEWRRNNNISFEDWKNLTFNDICHEITVGFVGKMKDKYEVSGIPFLRSQNVRPFRFSSENLLFISEGFHQEVYKSHLEAGDLAIVRSGAPGTTCVIPSSLGEANCSDLVIARPSSKLNSNFGCIFMNSEVAQRNIAANQVGVAQQHFNVGSMKKMPIHLPSIEEQSEIVTRVEQLFTYADQIEQRVKDAQARVNHLTQSILAKAFRGELTAEWRAQNPDLISGENSAEALLTKIKAERERDKAKKNTRQAKSA